jgi:hypothetical protein
MTPTIFITISDGEVAKSILETDIVARLKGTARLVLLVQPRSIDYFSRYADETVAVEALPAPRWPRVEEFFSDLFLYSLHTNSILVKIEHSFRSGGSQVGRIIKLMLWGMGRWYPYRVLCRMAYRMMPDHSLDALFAAHTPNLVFVANLTSIDDARLLKTARRRGVATIGMPKGWDNLTLKTFLPVFPDRLLVQTPLMKADAIQLDYPADRISVTGFPKFDIYADHAIIMPREQFLQAFGFDPHRKLILYAGAGDQLAPHDEEILARLIGAIEEGTVRNKPQVLVRPHPKYTYRADILPKRDFWALDRPGKELAGSNFVFERDDIVHLANSLYHCDVLVHTASTLGIEAAIYDRPPVTIAFDGPQSVHPALSVARYYRYEHLERVLRTGGMRVARNFEELVRDINGYLNDPSADRDGRARMVSENAYHVDGRAGARVAEEIIAMLDMSHGN